MRSSASSIIWSWRQSALLANPVKPTHFLKQGRPLPKKLSGQQVKQLFAADQQPNGSGVIFVDAAVRVESIGSGAVETQPISIGSRRRCWSSKAKGAKIAGYICQLMRWKGCESVCDPTNRRRRRAFLLESEAEEPAAFDQSDSKEDGAVCESWPSGCQLSPLRHTFASNLLEEGAEVISIKEFLGHESITSSERYARLSNQKVKQIYLQTIKKVIQKTKV